MAAEIDLPAVTDEQLTAVLQGYWQQISRLHAQWWATMVEIGRRQPPVEESHPWREVAPWEWGSNQISAALTFTSRRADTEYQVAQQLVLKLPLVFAALQAGRIDPPKAKLFVSYLAELTDPQIARISARLLPGAPDWTTGQLAYRLLREVLAIDPGFTRRRYRAAVRERGVCGYLAEDGSAVLSAHGLSPTEAAAAAERLEQLAAAVRAAGHPRTEQQLRADLFVRLLDGRYTGFTRDQIIAAMLTDTDADTDGQPAGTTVAANPEPAAARSATPDPDPDPGPTTFRGDPPSPEATTPASPTPPPAPDPEVADPTEATPAQQQPELARTSPPAEGARTGIEVRIGLGTLLGFDDHPAELPGWGPIDAETARQLVARQHTAQWRFAVLNDAGHLVVGGLIRRRPATSTRTSRTRGGIVEVHIQAALLTDLAGRDDLPPDWLAVITDLTCQYAHRATTLHSLDRCPRARFPGSGLRRHIQMRDRTCIAPGCRRPARRIELDHTIDHARGGATVRANLGPLYLRHHRMKHYGGWTLTQPMPGLFRCAAPSARPTGPGVNPSPPTSPNHYPTPERPTPEPPTPNPRHRGPRGGPERQGAAHRTDLPPVPESETSTTRAQTRTSATGAGR